MALWLVRGGKHGQHEQKFLKDNCVYATWDGFSRDFMGFKDRQEMRDALRNTYADASEKAIINYSGQLWPFGHEMKLGDWVVMPLKGKPAIAIGEIAGEYQFHPKADDPYFHSRKVKWLVMDMPRSSFEQDLLYSFGAFMTICHITRNDAEARVRAMAKAGWPPGGGGGPGPGPEPPEEVVDLELLARDRIAKLIISKFKGHAMETLVEAILKAQGYTTYRSPEEPENFSS